MAIRIACHNGNCLDEKREKGEDPQDGQTPAETEPSDEYAK
jgi:hypothetical protein